MDAALHDQDGWLTRENSLGLLLLAGSTIVFYVCYLLIEPFLTGIVFGMALALFLRGTHRRLRSRASSNVSAALATVLGGLLVMAPLWFVGNQVAQEVLDYAHRLSTGNGLEDIDRALQASQAAPMIGWIARTVDVKAEFVKLLGAITSRTPALLQLLLWAGGQFVLSLIVCFYLLRDRSRLLAVGRHLVPLSDDEYDEVKQHLADSMRATVVGSITMGALQGTLGGIAFMVLGLPAPIVWGAVMGVFSVVPMAGAFVVWVPAAVVLVAKGEAAKAVGLALWGFFVIGTIDNMLYPVVVGTKIRLHPLAVLIAVLGGVAVFGTAGVVLGPLVLSAADVLVEIWRRRTRAGRAAETGVER